MWLVCSSKGPIITVKDIRGVLRLFLNSAVTDACVLTEPFSVKQCAYIMAGPLEKVIYSRSTVDWSFWRAFTFRLFQGPDEFVCLSCLKVLQHMTLNTKFYMAKEGGHLKMSFRCRDEVKKNCGFSSAASLLSELHQLLCLSGQQHQPALIIYISLSARRARRTERENTKWKVKAWMWEKDNKGNGRAAGMRTETRCESKRIIRGSLLASCTGFRGHR